MVEKKSLAQDELQKKIKELVPDWKAGENERGVPYIERVKHASTYMEGIDFVTKVAVAAEANNHHPDIHIILRDREQRRHRRGRTLPRALR